MERVHPLLTLMVRILSGVPEKCLCLTTWADLRSGLRLPNFMLTREDSALSQALLPWSSEWSWRSRRNYSKDFFPTVMVTDTGICFYIFILQSNCKIFLRRNHKETCEIFNFNIRYRFFLSGPWKWYFFLNIQQSYLHTY